MSLEHLQQLSEELRRNLNGLPDNIQDKIFHYVDMAYGVGFDFGRLSTFSNTKKIIKMDKYGNHLKTFYCIADAARNVNVSKRNLEKHMAGEKHHATCKGFVFRYDE